MKARDINSEFRHRTLRAHGITVLSADNAYAMIRTAKKSRVRVLGIDSFLLRGDTIQPFLEHSVDYSMRRSLSDFDWDEALAFVQSKASLGLVFEVVLGDEVKVEHNGDQQR